MSPNELLTRIQESLESAYARESQEKKRIRQKNTEQMEVALTGGDDPFGKPAASRSK